jgi:chromate transporter
VKELALVFLRLGTTAFGGPAAHIAMMEDEFVRRRAWLTGEQFLDLVGAAGLIPGPSSTEVAIYVGYRRAGWRGLLVAGLCFILPAALMVTAIAWAYVRFGRLPAVGGALYGIKPVIIAIIGQALVAFGRTALKSTCLVALGIAAAIANTLGASPLVVLLVAGIVCAAVRVGGPPNAGTPSLVWPGALGASAVSATTPALAKLFLVFLKVGAIVFGSGYVLLAFLRSDLVERTHWLTETQLIDAVAVGQFTPGPVFTTATFIGYVVAGFPGAEVATIGIFLHVVRARGRQRTDRPTPASFAPGGGIPRRSQRRIARIDGRGRGPTRAGCDRRRADGDPRTRQRCRSPSMARQHDMDRLGRSGCWSHLAIVDVSRRRLGGHRGVARVAAKLVEAGKFHLGAVGTGSEATSVPPTSARSPTSQSTWSRASDPSWKASSWRCPP